MEIQGRCYCGAVRFKSSGDPVFKAQCQYASGGHPNVVIGMPEGGFQYSTGKAKGFRRSDLPNPVTREFCAECGTQILSRAPGLPGTVLIKVGTLDDPSVFDKPDMVIFTIDKQGFHHLPEGVPSFERTP